MSAEAREPGPTPPRLLALPVARLHWLSKLGLLLVTAGVLAAAGYLATLYYPRVLPPQPSAIEKQAAAVFGLPADGHDEKVVGDLLVERFYALDAESGEHYVGDVLKGRIEALQPARKEDSSGPYTLLLDLRNLQRDRALYQAFIEEVARPQGDYLGLRVLPGISDAFALNYDGSLPAAHATFRGPDGEDVARFLTAQSFAKVTANPHVVRVDGYNYLLSNTDLFSFFRIEFRTGKAIFLSELLIVDTTARPQRLRLFQLQEQYKAR